MITIEHLTVKLAKKIILKDVFFQIPPGETHVLFGPNGSGKTTLLMTMMGFPEYEVISGRILFQGKDITSLPIDERARRGLGLSFQRPPTIKGLKTEQLLRLCNQSLQDADLVTIIERYHFEDFLGRDINQGFSGGEIKKSEIIQLLLQEPTLVLLDEPESGVDLENIAMIGEMINQLLKKRGIPHQNEKSRRQWREERLISGLIITHTGYILDYVEADRGHVMMDGSIACSGNPREILQCIKELGYEGCVRCLI